MHQKQQQMLPPHAACNNIPRAVFIQCFSALLCKQKQTRGQKAGKCPGPDPRSEPHSFGHLQQQQQQLGSLQSLQPFCFSGCHSIHIRLLGLLLTNFGGIPPLLRQPTCRRNAAGEERPLDDVAKNKPSY